MITRIVYLLCTLADDDTDVQILIDSSARQALQCTCGHGREEGAVTSDSDGYCAGRTRDGIWFSSVSTFIY